MSNELLRKLKVQFRVVGTDEWMEQSILRIRPRFDVTLRDLQPNTPYEYRCILEDLSGNQLITDWEIL